MGDLKQELQKIIDCDIKDDDQTLEQFSHDASMFELRPKIVVAPKTADDVKKIVKYVAGNKQSNSDLSLTVRSGGTCMSGGSINDSIILDFDKHFNKILSATESAAATQPGVYYRDFEAETLKHGALMPSYPASRELCTVGGMVANNAGGEKSLEFGKTEEYINELKVILSDGNEYSLKPLNKEQLKKKISQNDFEGQLYKNLYELITENYDAIISAKPKVSKDSTGYHIWNVWNPSDGMFDITRLITGSQGTLGIITEINFKLVKHRPHSGTLVVFLRSMDDLGELIKTVVSHKPASFEGFDNYTLMLSFKLFFSFRKRIGLKETIKLAFKLIPDAFMLLRGIPKMVLLIEFDGDSPEDIKKRVHKMHNDLKYYGHEALFEEDETEEKSKKFWIMRRESFNLLRQKVKDKHTAPFMDDLIVRPEHLPEFLPKIRKIIKKYKLMATIAGHMGDGNFHIIPLMNIENPSEKAKLEPAMKEINALILKYNGSLSGEHNDGMIRGPWLKDMYGDEILGYFKQVKIIFDPKNIFNPHKKTDADWDYSIKHLREKF